MTLDHSKITNALQIMPVVISLMTAIYVHLSVMEILAQIVTMRALVNVNH
jgi:hypothetical protein